MRASCRSVLALVATFALLSAASTAVAGASSRPAAVLRDGLPPTVAPLAARTSQAHRAGAGTIKAAAAGTAVAVGSLPTGVAANDTTAVVANSNSNTASILDLTTNPATVTATVPVGRFPDATAISPNGTTAYVANFKAGTLSIIDLGTDTVTHVVTVENDPDSVLQIGSSVYVSNLLSGTISVVDPTSGTVTSTITLTGSPQPAPSGLAEATDGNHLYVDDVRNGKMLVLDLTTNPVSQVGSTAVGVYPAYLAVDGTNAYVANANLAGPTPGTVSVVGASDPTTPVLTHTVGVGSHPYGIAESPFLGEALVSNSGDGTMSVIDTSTNAVVGSPVNVGTTPDAVVVTPDQTTALVTDEGDNAVRILHINQPPAIVVPGSQSVQANDSSGTHNQLSFSSGNSNLLSAADSDADGNPEQVSLSVAHGVLTLSGTSGLTFSAGSNGSGSMTFTGALADINTALAGMTYEPSLNFVGADTLTASIDDQGNTGDIGKPETTTNTVSINVLNGGPTAGSPSFSGAIGNTVFGVGTSPPQPSYAIGGTVLTGSTDPNGDTLTAAPGTISTTQGGSVSMNSDGSFTYTPPVGYLNGNDTFTFEVTDGTNTSPGTATITVLNARVWYVDSALATNGNGESTSPFNTLSSAQTAATDNGDDIFLFGGASQKTYSGNITLKPSQELIGQPAGLSVFSETLLTGSGVNPIIKASSGTDVTIDNGTVINSVDEGQSAAGVTGISGSSVTNFTSAGSADTADNGVNLSGGSGVIHFFSTSTINSAAHSVQIASRTGGSVLFDGSVNDSGSGVSLTNNSGTPISFTGGLTVATTGSNPAFTATGGGTVKVTGAGNTLNAPGATALDVENTTIDAAGLTFRSISAGSTAGPVRGIYLNTTGTSGGLTVTGTGTTAGSGGTIQNGTVSTTSNPAYSGQVEAVSTGPISLSNMTVNNATHGDDIGIFDATGLTLTGDTITNAADQGAYYQLGTSAHTDATAGGYSISNSTFTGDASDDIYIFDESGGATSGTISGNTIGSTGNKISSATNGTGILIDNVGNGGTLTTAITNNTITGAKAGFGIQGNVQDYPTETASPTMNATVTGNSIDLESGQAQDGINFGSGDGSHPATLCLDSNTNTAHSNGQASQGAPFDAVGESVYQNGSASTFNIKGGPVESAGAGNEDTVVESYENAHNTFTAGGGPQSQPSFALQEFGNGFTTAASCPTVSSGARVTARSAAGKATAAAIRAAARAHIRARARHARTHGLTRAQVRARIQAYRRELAAQLPHRFVAHARRGIPHSATGSRRTH